MLRKALRCFLNKTKIYEIERMHGMSGSFHHKLVHREIKRNNLAMASSWVTFPDCPALDTRIHT